MSKQWPEFVEKFRKHSGAIQNKSKYTCTIGDNLPTINARSKILCNFKDAKKIYDKRSKQIFEKHNLGDIELYDKIFEENKRRNANV
jgi:hypothetical protein